MPTTRRSRADIVSFQASSGRTCTSPVRNRTGLPATWWLVPAGSGRRRCARGRRSVAEKPAKASTRSRSRRVGDEVLVAHGREGNLSHGAEHVVTRSNADHHSADSADTCAVHDVLARSPRDATTVLPSEFATPRGSRTTWTHVQVHVGAHQERGVRRHLAGVDQEPRTGLGLRCTEDGGQLAGEMVALAPPPRRGAGGEQLGDATGADDGVALLDHPRRCPPGPSHRTRADRRPSRTGSLPND